ncbi:MULTISPECIES: very short patch repair endonuclease [Alphaproteobacteria]|uniref:Very short patch repair endonuclease n=1 Tax=Marinicauda pacifica TaxID=1133559 RepID=A0A4S2H995_9PROT|nr:MULTISPECIES: very short patch repair endonuclease [Marinicauda]TGY92424.1 DNA mismatch endonuclease Vsr [Marinicauda pacifica]
MVDTRTPAQRRRIMQSVASQNTGPEMVVRRLLHSLGYRYRLHDRRLPGTPDIVFRKKKKAIFVHGCFWHAHDCPKGRPPRSREEFWQEKRKKNTERDARNIAELEVEGWSVLVVWQCETKDRQTLSSRLTAFVDNAENPIDESDSSH